jgi:ribosome-associated protein
MVSPAADSPSSVTPPGPRVTSRRVRTLDDRQREQAKANTDDRELESRTDRRRQQDARETLLKELAVRLVSSKPAALERLALDDELFAAIATAQAIRSAAARNRQVNVVRQHLRAFGPALDALVRRLDEPGRGRAQGSAQPSPRSEPSPALRAWLERLAGEGDAALEDLMRLHPSADRQQLRQRTRELSRARAAEHAPSLARAEQRLRVLLEPMVAGSPPDPAPAPTE